MNIFKEAYLKSGIKRRDFYLFIPRLITLPIALILMVPMLICLLPIWLFRSWNMSIIHRRAYKKAKRGYNPIKKGYHYSRPIAALEALFTFIAVKLSWMIQRLLNITN